MLEPTAKGKEKTWKSGSPETTEYTIQLLFFKKGGNQHVKKLEVEDIRLEELIQNLKQGESILITRKHTSSEKEALNADEEMTKPWYFAHV